MRVSNCTVASFQSAVFVLHAFEKKTQRTRQSDIELARKRYKEVENREQKKISQQRIP